MVSTTRSTNQISPRILSTLSICTYPTILGDKHTEEQQKAKTQINNGVLTFSNYLRFQVAQFRISR